MKYFLFLPLTLFAACTTVDSAKTQFQNWQARLAERKTFQMRKAWVKPNTEKTNLTFRKINRMSPILYVSPKYGEMLIAGNAVDGLVGYNRYSGEEIWRVKVNNGVEGSGTLIKDTIFFGGNDGQFYSVDANNGKIIWTFPTRIENLSEPLLDDGVVYFLTGSNTLYALDASSGKQLWIYSRQDTSALSVRGGSRPAIRNGILYVGFSDGYFVALVAKSGQMKWEKQLNKNKKFRDLDANPLIDGEFVYIAGFDDYLYALRAASGDVVWRSDKGGGYGNLLIIGDRLYYASTQSEFNAVDKTTGRKIWTHSLKEGLATSAAVYRGMIVVGESQGALKFLDSGTGKLVGAFDPGRGILTPPSVDEKKNFVFFMSGEANLYALEVGFKYPNQIPYLR
jgi:outer membrane protein assembly factor BamB